MAAFSTSQHQHQQEQRSFQARKKLKGPPQPPIAHVPEERRLFTVPNPSTGECLLLQSVQCFSLYNFVDVSDPVSAAQRLREALDYTEAAATTMTGGDNSIPLPRPYEDFVGTVHIAKEGVNAQFALRTDYPMKSFEDALRNGAGGLLDGVGNFNMGDALPAGSPTPFKRFRVIARQQILTDGLLSTDDTLEDTEGLRLDFRDAGPELSAAEWHEHLLKVPENTDTTTVDAPPPALLLDCRNRYESDVGTFRGAAPLGTDTFAESWQALDAAVSDLPKNTPVYTFCTGGIRCVKVNAYLKQHHGMNNIHRLEHGIIGYERWINNSGDGNQGGAQQNLFEGKNFIFDERTASSRSVGCRSSSGGD